jgi:RNA polymerase sigma-70 factor (ECF subfamily)
VRAYVYRVTLDHDLTEDLSQEVLLQMVKSLEKLSKTEHFWPWLYRIAQSKIQQHFKAKHRRASVSDSAFYQDFVARRGNPPQADGLREAIQDELSAKVLAAMRQIKQQYRAVLALRCFEQLSYADIGIAMQCSEVTARVLFFRAKQALKRQLGRQGLSKSLLLMSLGLFGRLTAPAEAGSSVVTVSASATQVGLTAAALATAGSRLGLAALAVAAVALIGVAGLALRPQEPLPSHPSFSRADVTSLHFTAQLMDGRPEARGSLSKGAYEQWFYFPDGIDGPMFMRMQRWDPAQIEKLCAWLENGQGNYYFDSLKNCIEITNGRVCWSNLKVRRLPTDTAEFTEFLSRAEGDLKALGKSQRDPNTGLLTSFVDYRFSNAPDFRTDYGFNTVGAAHFQYDWPVDVPIIDDRDPMHKRGWTYFYIAGKVDGREISGRGRIPFVYDASQTHPAWMSLRVGNDLEIIDCQRGAYMQRGDGTVAAAYPPGTFFKGLARPWMGLHAADAVRRDAVEQRVWFESEYAPNETDVIVTLYCDAQQTNADVIYTIDMENDVIREIGFVINNQAAGSLNFSYLQNIEHVGDEFTEPGPPPSPPLPHREAPGALWLFNLGQGNLGG